jgi:hypothetical protein
MIASVCCLCCSALMTDARACVGLASTNVSMPKEIKITCHVPIFCFIDCHILLAKKKAIMKLPCFQSFLAKNLYSTLDMCYFEVLCFVASFQRNSPESCCIYQYTGQSPFSEILSLFLLLGINAANSWKIKSIVVILAL